MTTPPLDDPPPPPPPPAQADNSKTNKIANNSLIFNPKKYPQKFILLYNNLGITLIFINIINIRAITYNRL
jgi:hypothetical protein